MAKIHFEATPYSLGSWMILPLPQAASAPLPSRGQVMVKGTINGCDLLAPLEPDGKGGHWLHVDANLSKKAHVSPGKAAKLNIEATKDWPEPTLPADVKAALQKHPDVKKLWDAVTPMARWEWLRWVNSTNQAATRQRRLEVSFSKLKAGSRRPCCFNRSMCCEPAVSKNGVLLAA